MLLCLFYSGILSFVDPVVRIRIRDHGRTKRVVGVDDIKVTMANPEPGTIVMAVSGGVVGILG